MRHTLKATMRPMVLAMLTLAVFAVPAVAASAADDPLVRLLIKKGILTEEEARAFKEAATTSAQAEAEPTGRDQIDGLRDEVRQEFTRREKESITLFARVEGEGRWRARRDVGNRDSGSTSDLFLRRAEVGLEFRPRDYLLGRLVVTSEWLGAQTTDQGQEPDDFVSVDEATLTLASEEWPVYAVVGKRTQPFGAFFSRLVTDPMTQDAYEVKQAGATLGVKPGFWDVDLSVTLYKGEEQLNHLFESGLFDAAAAVRSSAAGLRDETDDVSSFLAAATLSPLKELTLGVGYLSEPGDGRRNQTGAVWLGYTWGPVTAEAEFFAALARERYVLAGAGTRFEQSFKEKVLAVGLSYRPLPPVELAARYERLWDGGLADRAETWSARNRASVGAGYTLYARDEIQVRLLGEYRFTHYRRGGAARDVAAPDQQEAFLKLAVSYK